jgi:hypothetical protein
MSPGLGYVFTDPVDGDGPQQVTLPSGLVANGLTIQENAAAYDGIQPSGFTPPAGAAS